MSDEIVHLRVNKDLKEKMKAYDEDYWKTQSDRFLYWITNHNGYYVHGGVQFSNTNTISEGILSKDRFPK